MRALGGRRILLVTAAVTVTAAGAAGVMLATTARSHAEPTRAQYLESVASVCRVYGPRLDRIRPPDVAEPANVIDAVDRVLPLVDAQLDRVERLVPPKEIEPEVRRWIRLQQRRLGILEKAQAAGRRQDFRALSVAYVDFLLAGRDTGALGQAIGVPHPPC